MIAIKIVIDNLINEIISYNVQNGSQNVSFFQNVYGTVYSQILLEVVCKDFYLTSIKLLSRTENCIFETALTNKLSRTDMWPMKMKVNTVQLQNQAIFG